MRRFLNVLVLTGVIVGLAAGPAMAQGLGTPPPGAGAPGAEAVPREKQVEGPVKKVDPAAKTVQVGWFLGLFRTTLQVNDDTQIMADGRKGSLEDIREGAKVKAAYELREGKYIAKSIEVMPAQAQETERAGTTGGSPAGASGPFGSPGSTGPGAPAGRPGS